MQRRHYGSIACLLSMFSITIIHMEKRTPEDIGPTPELTPQPAIPEKQEKTPLDVIEGGLDLWKEDEEKDTGHREQGPNKKWIH